MSYGGHYFYNDRLKVLRRTALRLGPSGSAQELETVDKTFKNMYDCEGFGEMSMDNFRAIIHEPEFRDGIIQMAGVHSLRRLERRTMYPHSLTYQEFVDLISNKRRRSFKVAVHERDSEVQSQDNFRIGLTRPQQNKLSQKMAHKIAKEFLPDPQDRKYYEDQYSCCPPPLFILLITLVELSFFAYYVSTTGEVSHNGPVPVDSAFIYRPDKRFEVWRFILYMVLHAGWVHLLFNMVIQISVGLPLEMVHGSLRIAAIYFAGVLAGSLSTSVFDTEVYLVGASGGVYALLAAHVANVLLNYSQMECGIFRIFCIFLIASADVGFAIWNRYAAGAYYDAQPVSYTAHLAGALAGITLGLVVLKSFEQRLYNQCIWWTALICYSACMLFAIMWNLLRY